jgi:hypothetical protein
MKKMFLTLTLMIAFLLRLVAQVDHDFNVNDRVPVVNASITKDQVPAVVLKAVNNQFNTSNPVTWSKFPYALKEYGWVYDVGAAQIPLDRYEVTMKTNSGNIMWALYNAEGELIETREVSNNIATPRSVQEALDKSQYKGWAIVGNKEIIKYYHDHDMSRVEQHFRVTVEKDNVQRTVSFNYQNKIGN